MLERTGRKISLLFELAGECISNVVKMFKVWLLVFLDLYQCNISQAYVLNVFILSVKVIGYERWYEKKESMNRQKAQFYGKVQTQIKRRYPSLQKK